MAENPLPGLIPQLLAPSEDMADGAQNHGAAIGLKQNAKPLSARLGADVKFHIGPVVS